MLMIRPHRRPHFIALSLLFVCASLLPLRASVWVPEGTAHTATDTPAEQNAKMGWWREARFGMFIHWGLYAVPGGEWKGQQIGGLGEWILKSGGIPIADYKAIASRFNPVRFNADAWVAVAKNAGMKYIIITAKHHDGFAMFRSKADPFNIYDATPFRRDPLQELAAACKKAGIRFGFYYSQDQDWTAPGGAVIGNTWDKAQEGDFTEYLRKKSLPQFKELLTNYQPAPDILWFDTPTTEMTPELAKQFVDILKQHPKLIWNERLGGGFQGNWRTPEGRIPANGIPGEDWETCMTMNDSWGFKKNDHSWKSLETIVRNLIDIASKGGNYLLNVGPTEEGLIPGPSVERLAEVGKWLKVNGEAIYGTTPAPFKQQPSWGRITRKGDTLYLHVFNWPQDGKLILAISNTSSQARLLAAPNARLSTASTAQGLEIKLPSQPPDRVASVIALSLRGPIQEILPPGIPQAADGSLHLKAAIAEIIGDKLTLEPGNEPNIGYWSTTDDYVAWAVAITRPGIFEATITYACDDRDAGSEFALAVGGQTVKGTVGSTGAWINYRTVTLGKLSLGKGGRLPVTLKTTRKGIGNIMNLRAITLTPTTP
jgi:alpha-L-fucosidase